jgi:hypothetical protein
MPGDEDKLINDLKNADRKTILSALDKAGGEARGISNEVLKKTSNVRTGNDGGGLVNQIGRTIAAGLKDTVNDTNRFLGVEINGILESMSKGDSGIIGNLTSVLTGALKGAEQVINSLAQIDVDARKQVVTIGGYYGDLAKGMMGQMMDIMGDTAALGITSKDVLEGVGNLAESSSRMATYSRETIVAGLEASAEFTNSNTKLLENAEKFRNVGLGLSDAAKAVTNIGMKSVSLGLNAKKVSEDIILNIEKLNSYGFKNGIEGLGRMVQEAKALNISIDKSLNIAEKLFDPAQAIDMSANLAALGGAFGDFADPIKLMYDATNNVEGLQKSLIGAARGLATYNAEQGRFEVAGANLRRANEIAKALGMSTGELANTAVKAANKFSAMSKLDMFPSLTKDQKEFVSNLATMKDGKIGFDLPEDVAKELGMKEGFRTIEEMGGNIGRFQQIQERIQSMKPEDLARQQYNAITNIANVVSGIAYRIGARTMKTDIVGGTEKTASAASNYAYNTFNAKGKTAGDLGNLALEEAKRGVVNLSESVLRAAGMSEENIKKTEQKVQEWKKEGAEGVEKMKKLFQEYVEPKIRAVYEKAADSLKGITGSNTKQPGNMGGMNGEIKVMHELSPNGIKSDAFGSMVMNNKVITNGIKTMIMDSHTDKSKKGQYDQSQMV